MVKCNTDGSAYGSPSLAAHDGLFRDSNAAILGCFSKNMGSQFSFQAELHGAMNAIEIAFIKGWLNL